MALPLLAVAQGAFNIGKKIFGGIKARQAKKKEKRAAKQLAKDQAIADLAEKFGIGSTQVSQAGNVIAALKEAKGEAVDPQPDQASAPQGNNQNILLIGAGLLIAALFLFKRGR